MTKTETLTEMAQEAWDDLDQTERVKWAEDYGFSDDDVETVDLVGAEALFINEWVCREWDNDFHHDTDPRV